MAVGDGGTPPGQLFDPYLPDATWPAKTELFHEMLRQDISTFTTPAYNSMRFVGSFNSPDLVVSSYSSADRVVNEACLIAGDGVLTAGLGRLRTTMSLALAEIRYRFTARNHLRPRT